MKFALENLELKIFLGVSVAERSKKQKILVSIFYEFEASHATKTDDLNESVDYQEIHDLIQRFSEKPPVKLLEKLHADLKNEICQKFPKIKNLTVKISKFPFPSGKVSVEG